MKKALVLSLAVVLGLGVASFAQTLSGSWDTTIGITPSPVALTIDSELIVTYAVSGWSFTSDTVLDETGWQGQEFDVNGALGAFSIGSALVFDPATALFDSWEVTGGLSIAGVSFEATFDLTDTGTTLEIVGSGSAGNVDVSIDLMLGSGDGCDFNFSGVTIDVGFPFCCADVTSEISFDCDGFNYVTFEVDGIAIPNLPWLSLDAVLKFTPGPTGGKTLTLTPAFDFGAIACFDLYIEQLSTGGIGPTSVLSLGDIVISGIGLDCTIGGVEFTGISYWGTGDKPGLLEDTDYWEAYQIKTTDDGCCGPFEFDITVYFLQGGLQLFDVAEIDANMSLQVAQQFTFSTGIAIDLTVSPAFTNWTIGFLVEW